MKNSQLPRSNTGNNGRKGNNRSAPTPPQGKRRDQRKSDEEPESKK